MHKGGARKPLYCAGVAGVPLWVGSVAIHSNGGVRA